MLNLLITVPGLCCTCFLLTSGSAPTQSSQWLACDSQSKRRNSGKYLRDFHCRCPRKAHKEFIRAHCFTQHIMHGRLTWWPGISSKGAKLVTRESQGHPSSDSASSNLVTHSKTVIISWVYKKICLFVRLIISTGFWSHPWSPPAKYVINHVLEATKSSQVDKINNAQNKPFVL